jgi:hypothetical protein
MDYFVFLHLFSIFERKLIFERMLIDQATSSQNICCMDRVIK